MTSNCVFPDDEIFVNTPQHKTQDFVKAQSFVSTSDDGHPVIIVDLFNVNSSGELKHNPQSDSIKLDVGLDNVLVTAHGRLTHVLDLNSGQLSMMFNLSASIFDAYLDYGKTVKTLLTVHADKIEEIRAANKPKA